MRFCFTRCYLLFVLFLFDFFVFVSFFFLFLFFFFFFCCFYDKKFAIRCIYSWFDEFKICKMVGNRPVRAFGFRNPGNSCSTYNLECSQFLWNLVESRILGFGIRITAQGIRILLRTGIWNPSFTARESGIQYRKSEF